MSCLQETFDGIGQHLSRIASQMIEDDQLEAAIALLQAAQAVVAAVNVLAKQGVDLNEDYA